ncbi:hypothetical protein FSP39_003541 [Pinctada imbricata]|uniref:Uncharacterized protein n=1 Tax=Pinctada imbricata TaxID=66713 RepID=A0AA88XEJ3_PINIB|nr:hypothetical protein FSP39_003541 [Pinctada imbricata]
MDNIDVTTTCIAVTFFILCYVWLSGRRRYPPGPFAPPIVGNFFWFKKDPKGYLRFTELSEKYGSVYRLYCGSTMIVFLNGFEAIHEAFVKQSSIFTDRPQLFVPLIGVSKGTGNNGPWKTLKRFTLQALRDFGVGKKSLEERVLDEVRVVTDILEKSGQQPTRVKPYLLSAATNIICSVMFGARFHYNDGRFQELTDVLESIFKLNAPFAKENFFPITRYLESGKELIKKRGAAIEKVKRYLAETIAEHENSFDENNIRDFIDLYLKAAKDKTDPEIFNDANIYKVIVDLFLAGGETTGTSLDWCLLYMTLYPNVQRKCQEELDSVVGRDRPVGLADKGKMPYLESTLLEIQRIANTLTFSLPHVTNQETQLLGFDIPKDAIVIANLYSAHIDKKYWDDPHEFRPERFLGENGKIRRREAFVPFSTGPRLCIGEPLARMELFLFFTNLLQTFTFKHEEGKIPSRDGIQALTLTPEHYDLIAVKRF